MREFINVVEWFVFGFFDVLFMLVVIMVDNI